MTTLSSSNLGEPAGPSLAIVIPARLGSSRFPGKPLATIRGIPMIERVYRNAAGAAGVDVTVVATCDREIAEVIHHSGGSAVMTGAHHQRATERTAEAVQLMETERGREFDIVVMLQGDEPLVSADQLNDLFTAMVVNPELQVANLMGRIRSESEFTDPNCIKVVHDSEMNALYFSRRPIPHGVSHDSEVVRKQVCAIGFRRDYLLEYVMMSPTPLEEAESIDMLRILQHGQAIRLIDTSRLSQSVDTPDDIVLVEQLMDAAIGGT